MNTEKANIIDTNDMFIMTYKLNVVNTASNEKDELEPILTANIKTKDLETGFFLRNQHNRIPVTIFI